MSEVLTILANREREWRRWVAISAALHVALLLGSTVAFEFFPHDREPPAGDPFVLVTPQELAAMMSPERPAAAPKPAQPKPEPAVQPEPEPPTPKTEEVIIPEDAARKPVRKKPEVETERTETPPKPRNDSQAQVDLDDLLAETRIEQGSMPTGPTRQATARPGAGGTGDPVSPEIAAWQNRVRAHVRRKMGLPPGFRGKGLKMRVVVTLTSSGDLLGYEVDRESGNPWFDEQVEQYLAKESSLPPPPNNGDWPLIIDGDL
ncbi:MAG: TonB C-terminal domain-containing protein [Deltaproteobacteria bacterium]|nr:TonB C-terminal domain-containing protein [Deltaproteobacteria bacterium]